MFKTCGSYARVTSAVYSFSVAWMPLVLTFSSSTLIDSLITANVAMWLR